MKRIQIIDNQFDFAPSFGCGRLDIPPKHFSWNRSVWSKIFGTRSSKYVFVTDVCIKSYLPKIKEGGKFIALILEPRAISEKPYQLVKDNYKKFDYVLSHDKEFLKDIPNGLYYPVGGCWIKPEDRAIYDKRKMISIIASDKKQTFGHNLRHEIIEKYRGEIDVFGYGYRPVDNKLEALKDYRFSIVIENCQRNGYFTEKLIDCYKTGTIPIYWGAPDIGHYFDINSMMGLSSLDTLMIMDGRQKEQLYRSKINHVVESMQKASLYTCPEDWMYENYPFLFV